MMLVKCTDRPRVLLIKLCLILPHPAGIITIMIQEASVRANCLRTAETVNNLSPPKEVVTEKCVINENVIPYHHSIHQTQYHLADQAIYQATFIGVAKHAARTQRLLVLLTPTQMNATHGKYIIFQYL